MANQPSIVVPPTRFRVADVEPAQAPLITHRAAEPLEQLARTRFVVCPVAASKVVAAADFHPLISAAAIAFKQHYPLVLSPDVIWITILQGVAQHISNHSSALRSRLVAHQTKIELVVDTNLSTLPANDAEMLAVVSAFKNRIANHLSPDKRGLLNVEFSTTTDVARIASCVAVMDGLQAYFDYVFTLICGIPEVILEGTPEDWELLSEKVRMLDQSDLELSWWTGELLPLLAHFERASRGDVDEKHWQDLCVVMERYGTEDLNGWLLKFIPYVRRHKYEPCTRRNPVVGLSDFSETPGTSEFAVKGCRPDVLPTGLSRAPVSWLNSASGKNTPIEFVAGLFGVGQDSQDLALRPLLGWAIAESTKIDRLIDELRARHDVRASSQVDSWLIARRFHDDVPADLGRFYAQTNGAVVQTPSGMRIELLPVEMVLPVFSEIEAKRLLKKKPSQVDRKEFAMPYETMVRIAKCDDGSVIAFGRGAGRSKSIFRWNGKISPDGLTPLADTFSDWLESVLNV